ncbi:MAG: FAD-binding oxidoreductase [Pseudomonadota bacterium]
MRYTAQRTPRFTSPAAWAEIIGGYPDITPLAGDCTADVVIVGAGFAGLSAARRLTQLDASLNIILLDALRVAEGSAGRNSGFMIDLPHDLSSDHYAGGADDRQMIDLNRRAIRFAQEAVADYQINPAYADPAGKINGAASAAGARHNQNYAKHLASLGEASEVLDAQSMRQVTGSAYYLSGLYTPGTLMLQPAGYVQGLASGLRRMGVKIHERTPVLGFERRGPDWALSTPNGDITAPKIILATNGHLESFGIARGQLLHLFLYASMTPELSDQDIAAIGGQGRWGVIPADPMGTTMRRIDTLQGGNRIITRTCATVRPSMEARSGDMRRAAKVQARKFGARFPALAGIPMAYEWAGHLCLTRNGVSVVQEIEQGVFTACVQNGLGAARGTLTGIAAAEQALHATSAIAKYFSASPAPKPLPPRTFSTWGANAYLRWKEAQAAAE